MPPIIHISGLTKSYGELHVLRGLDLDIDAGEVVSIIGPSGSGKSTVLRLLMTLEHPDQGVVDIDGEPLYTEDAKGRSAPVPRQDLYRVRAKLGMVFQHFNLFPHMKVLRNVTEAPVHVAGLSRAEAEERALKYLRLVGLEDKLDAHPAQLSGGQKQRVAIARALAMEPKILLFDEITSALDPELVGGILDLLRDLAAAGDRTMLIVTHQMNFARDVSHRVLFFDHGVILEDGPPDQILVEPEHERTQEFLKSVLEA